MRLFFTILFAFFWTGTCLASMVSVSVNSSCLRSHPSPSASYVLLQAPLYYPLQVDEEKDDFYHVTDFLGRAGWIAKNDVKETRCVVVKNGTINVRQGPGTDNKVIFMAKQGVTFKVISERKDWLEVMHESGKKGWVYRNIIWGL